MWRYLQNLNTYKSKCVQYQICTKFQKSKSTLFSKALPEFICTFFYMSSIIPTIRHRNILKLKSAQYKIFSKFENLKFFYTISLHNVYMFVASTIQTAKYVRIKKMLNIKVAQSYKINNFVIEKLLKSKALFQFVC